MIDHLSINVSDIEKSKAFYQTVLFPLNNELVLDLGTSIAFGEKASFWLVQGKPQSTHVAFTANSKAEVTAFYEAAIKAGGIGNGEPGLRPNYGENYYAAFVFDLDGHNIEAVYHGN